MTDLVKRRVQANRQLAGELLRRGILCPAEVKQLATLVPVIREKPLLAPSRLFASLLATGDCQLAARAIARGVVDRREIVWLDKMLRLVRRHAKAVDTKGDELRRIVERQL